MTTVEKRLCLAGFLLFVFGLLLGFALPMFPARQAAVGAHETALQGGTFLIAMGLLWPKLDLSSRRSALLANLLWISFVLVEAGLTLGAALASSSQGPGKAVITALNIGGAVLMLAATLILIPAFGSRTSAALPTKPAD